MASINLLHAEFCGQVEILIDNGARINEQDKDGRTPLYLAVEMHHANVASL
jgi:ankyrin repeat protein